MLPVRSHHIIHDTEYEYATPVVLAQHLLHLRPRNCAWQCLNSVLLKVDPEPGHWRESIDAFGNPVARIAIDGSHRALTVTSTLHIEVGERPWAHHAPTGGLPWEQVLASLEFQSGGPLEPMRYRHRSPNVLVKSQLSDYACASFAPGRPLLDACTDLMGRIHRDFTFDPEATEVGTSVLDLLDKKRGVCQDFAHFMIAALRAYGLSARYVSGYLLTEPPPGQPRLVGVDASHAWVAAWIPDGRGGAEEHRWIEFDPTNNCLADQRHIVVAWGRDFSDVSPLRGVIQGGAEHDLKVRVTVMPADAGD